MNFPPVYVVSLARAVERREKMRAQLEGLGMRAEFTDAVDGETADLTPYSDRLHPDKWRVLRGRELSNAAIACYLSHYRIWERVAAGGEQCALVLEDDALLHDGFCDVVRELQNCRWQWDVIMLSGRKRRPIDTVLDKIGDTGRRLVRYRVRVGGAVAYLVSSSGAKKLLTQCREISAPVDWRYAEWWLNGLAFYYVDPFVARNAPVPSFINKPRRLPRTFSEWRKARRKQLKSWLLRHYVRWTVKPRLAWENEENKSATGANYGTHFLYRARREYRHFDDSALTDEYQLEVYLHALGLMKKHNLRSVMDVGCGSGYKLMTYLGEYDTVGTEVAVNIEMLRQKYPQRKWQESAFSSRQNRGADLVVCADVIEHLPNPDELLAYLKALPFRFLVLSTPARDVNKHALKMRRWFGPPNNRCHIREWTFREFRNYISSRGFDILTHRVTNLNQRTQMIVCTGKGQA